MTAYRAGSRACSWLNCLFFFALLFFSVQKNWASYEALSQQRGIEPATWHWASNEGMVNLYCTGSMDFPMQPLQLQQIKLLMNSGTIWDKIEDWQSIHMYTYITPIVYIYIYTLTLQRPLMFGVFQEKWHFFPKVLFLKSSTVFCTLEMFIHGGTAETVEIK